MNYSVTRKMRGRRRKREGREREERERREREETSPTATTTSLYTAYTHTSAQHCDKQKSTWEVSHVWQQKRTFWGEKEREMKKKARGFSSSGGPKEMCCKD